MFQFRQILSIRRWLNTDKFVKVDKYILHLETNILHFSFETCKYILQFENWDNYILVWSTQRAPLSGSNNLGGEIYILPNGEDI